MLKWMKELLFQDLREQLLNIDEVIPDAEMVTMTFELSSRVLAGFHTSLNLSMRGNPIPFTF